MIWTSEDVARDQVRRQAAGLNAQQISRAVDEAVVRVRETLEALPSSAQASREELAPDAEVLAERWVARLAEWQRVAAHLAETGADSYDGALDKDGSAWAREREERRAEVLRVQAQRAQAAYAQRRAQQDELQAEVRLSAGAGRQIRAAAQRAGLSPHEVLAQLTERVVFGEDGTLSVAPFVPGHVPGGE
ncbi:hypothetical protein AB0N79_36390 [Streptomyces microflavus]|uniref:hypothetical protein n=1 Tax=Streptomyces microflavus TaxID=1919 RepID=UPI00225B0A8F|nr:hypothetical protein [Streptomyces microflavus]MCX4657408.1 hypothetical protein [Streptomyces microflavus]